MCHALRQSDKLAFFNFDIINMVMRCWLLLVTLGISMVFDLRPVENT